MLGSLSTIEQYLDFECKHHENHVIVPLTPTRFEKGPCSDIVLAGQPVAVQHHADIIAVSYEARKLGVTKHMSTKLIRQQFPSVKLVHVQVKLGQYLSLA